MLNITEFNNKYHKIKEQQSYYMQIELLKNQQDKPVVSFEHSNVNASPVPTADKYNWYNSSLSVQKIPSIQLLYSIVLLQCKSAQIRQ